MPLFQESVVRARAQREVTAVRSAFSALNEHTKSQERAVQHDIFLSHSFEDRELVLGTVLLIEDLGYKVYLDWRDDPSLDRKKVSATTATKIKSRLRNSKCLLYSITHNAKYSVWMKWELGLKDGMDGKTAILPITNEATNEYKGQEFLGIYPYLSIGKVAGTSHTKLWVRRSLRLYTTLDNWLNGKPFTLHS